MDVNQLIPQIGTVPTSGELPAFGSGHSFGPSTHEKGFSQVLQAVSHRIEAKREAKSHASDTEDERRSSGTLSTGQRGQSRRTDGSRGAKRRDAQAEGDNRSVKTTPLVNRSLPHKPNEGTDQDPRPSQPGNTDQLSNTPSQVSSASEQATTFSQNMDSHVSQSEADEDTSSPAIAGDPLLTSLVGTAMATQSAPIDPVQVVADSVPSTGDVDAPAGLLESMTSQPGAPTAEEMARSMDSAKQLGAFTQHNTFAETGDTVVTAPVLTTETKPSLAGADANLSAVAQPDREVPLTAQQGQTIENIDPNQGIPVKEHLERDVRESRAPSEPVVVQGPEVVEQTATATTQASLQLHEEHASEPGQTPVQRVLGKGELSLHQKQGQLGSAEAQAAVTSSGRMQDEGQGFTAGSNGKGADERLKWLAHVGHESAALPAQAPEPAMVESADGEHQYSSYQPGQGGAPSTVRTAAGSTVPAPPQAGSLSLEPDPIPGPRTHAVQFDMAPADFGQLRVRVVLSDHTIHTHLSTDRPELGQMLAGQQEQLSTQLTAAGLDLGRFQVQVDQERSHLSGQDGQSQAHGGTTPQQRDSRQQDRLPQDAPAPLQKRTGVLSLFA